MNGYFRAISLLMLLVFLSNCQVQHEAGLDSTDKSRIFHISEKPTAYQEADRLAIWYPASDFEALGLYLPPNQAIEIFVRNISGSTQPELLVGTYSRYLTDQTPNVHKLVEGNNTITDELGGLLYLRYVTEAEPNGNVEVIIQGGNPIPSYVLGESTHESWLAQLDTMAYENVQLVSDRTMVVISRATAQQYRGQDQDTMLSTLDRAFEAQDYISGIDGSSELHDRNRHKILITELTEQDLDYSLAALEHRIIVPTAAINNVMDPAFTSSEAWGIWHEMGHHHQALNWDWDEVDEVTVNIYSLASLYEFEGSIKWLKDSDIWDTVDAYLQSPIEHRNFNTDKTITGRGRLAMFRQLWLAYGDEFYIKVHRLAREDNAKPVPRIEARDLVGENQMANFMVFAAKASGNDLSSFFREWGFVVEDDVYAELAALALPAPQLDLLALRE